MCRPNSDLAKACVHNITGFTKTVIIYIINLLSRTPLGSLTKMLIMMRSSGQILHRVNLQTWIHRWDETQTQSSTNTWQVGTWINNWVKIDLTIIWGKSLRTLSRELPRSRSWSKTNGNNQSTILSLFLMRSPIHIFWNCISPINIYLKRSKT